MNFDVSCVKKKNITSYGYLPSFASYNEQTSASTDHQQPKAFHNLKEKWQYIRILVFCVYKSTC